MFLPTHWHTAILGRGKMPSGNSENAFYGLFEAQWIGEGLISVTMGDWDWELFLEVFTLIVACLAFLAGFYTSCKSQQLNAKKDEYWILY